MASAIRLKYDNVAVVTAGDFGKSVGSVISRICTSSTLHSQAEIEKVFDSHPSAVVAAISTPDTKWCDKVDVLAHEYETPWLPVMPDHPRLRVGPWTVPGRGPCVRCFDNRRLQHDRQWESSRLLRTIYDQRPDAGPAGFLPQHARLAGGISASLLSELQEENAPPGLVVSVELPRMSISTDVVVSGHGCSRCRQSRSGSDLRRLQDTVMQEIRRG